MLVVDQDAWWWWWCVWYGDSGPRLDPSDGALQEPQQTGSIIIINSLVVVVVFRGIR